MGFSSVLLGAHLTSEILVLSSRLYFKGCTSYWFWQFLLLESVAIPAPRSLHLHAQVLSGSSRPPMPALLQTLSSWLSASIPALLLTAAEPGELLHRNVSCHFIIMTVYTLWNTSLHRWHLLRNVLHVSIINDVLLAQFFFTLYSILLAVFPPCIIQLGSGGKRPFSFQNAFYAAGGQIISIKMFQKNNNGNLAING